MDSRVTDPGGDTLAAVFREEAERARRYAATIDDRKIAGRLQEIAAAYDELAAGQEVGPADRE